MTAKVVTVGIETGVREIAGLLLKHRISAVPVVDADRRVLGIVSEGDLMRRGENETERRHSWWLEAVFSTSNGAERSIKSPGRKAADIMTRTVIAVAEDTPLFEIAELLEKHHVKRVPVTRDGTLVGIVSRANLLHGLAAKGSATAGTGSSDDRAIRKNLLDTLSNEAGIDTSLINVTVSDGNVHIWGIIGSDVKKTAARVAAENIPGVKSVENHLRQIPGWVWAQ